MKKDKKNVWGFYEPLQKLGNKARPIIMMKISYVTQMDDNLLNDGAWMIICCLCSRDTSRICIKCCIWKPLEEFAVSCWDDCVNLNFFSIYILPRLNWYNLLAAWVIATSSKLFVLTSLIEWHPTNIYHSPALHVQKAKLTKFRY